MHSNHNGQHIPGNTFIPQLNATVARKFTLVWYKQKHVSTQSNFTDGAPKCCSYGSSWLSTHNTVKYEGAAAQWSVSQDLKRGNLMDYEPCLLLLHMKSECGFLALIFKKYEVTLQFGGLIFLPLDWIIKLFNITTSISEKVFLSISTFTVKGPGKCKNSTYM